MAAERLRCLNILGLQNDASEEDIKKAYKKAALRVHPDKNDSHDANERFQELSFAYKYLTDGPSGFQNNQDDDMRAEAFRRMFAEMFMPPQFFYGARGGFSFFFNDPYDDDFDDYDLYYSSDDSDDYWSPRYSAYDKKDGQQYNFSHTNAQPGPEMSSKQIRKKEKRRRQRARQKERKENKPAPPKQPQQKSPQQKPQGQYTDDINDPKGANKENREKTYFSRPHCQDGQRKGPSEQNKPPSTGFQPGTESNVKTERSSTPGRNEQGPQKMNNKATKKKMESEQRKREKEMEEIAAELLRQQEEKREKQRRKEEQEKRQKEQNKPSSNFQPFSEFNMPEPKSRKQKKRDKRKEEEDQCPLPKESNKNTVNPDPFIGQAKESPFGPIGSKIPGKKPNEGTGATQNPPQTGTGTGATEVKGPWYNPYQEASHTTSGQMGPKGTASQPQKKTQGHAKPQQKKQKDAGLKEFGVPRQGSSFCQRNQFDVLDLDVSDEDEVYSLEEEEESDNDQAGDHSDQPKPFQGYQPSQQGQQFGYGDKPTQQVPLQPKHFTNQTHKFTSASFNMDRNARNQSGYDVLDDIDDISPGNFSHRAPPPSGTNLNSNSKQHSAPGANPGSYHSKTEKPSGINGNQYRQNVPPPNFVGSQEKNFGKPPPNFVGSQEKNFGKPPPNFAGSQEKSFGKPPPNFVGSQEKDFSKPPPNFVGSQEKNFGKPPPNFVGSQEKSFGKPPPNFVGSQEKSFSKPPPNFVGSQEKSFGKPPPNFVGSQEKSFGKPPPNFVGSKEKNFSKPPPRKSPSFGDRATPPMNGYGPRASPVNFGFPPANGVNDPSQFQAEYNPFGHPPGFATQAPPPRPKAFGGYHDIGTSVSSQNSYQGYYGDQNNTGGNSWSDYNNVKNPYDPTQLNGVRKGQKREGTPPGSANAFGVGSFPSWKHPPSNTTPSMSEPAIKSSRNSFGSLDSLDDFPVHSTSDKPSSQRPVNSSEFDLTSIEARFEGMLGKDELNVPGGMFTDTMKNYYK